MGWRVEYLDETVKEEIERLAVDVRAKFARIVELIMLRGILAMHEPHIKHLEGRLWEMRMTGRDGIARAIYVTAAQERVVILHAFVKKTNKTPARALQLARSRARKVSS